MNEREKLLIKFWTWFSICVIVGMFGFLVQSAIWIWYPYDIVEFDKHCCNEDGTYFNGEVINENKKVKRGGILSVKLSFQKNYDIPAFYVTRSLTNDRYVTLVVNETGTLSKGRHTKIFNIFIPHNVWPGRYRLENVFTYRPNPFRSINEKWISEWFEVLE